MARRSQGPHGEREVFGRVTLVEVTGGIDFAALAGVVEDLLSA